MGQGTGFTGARTVKGWTGIFRASPIRHASAGPQNLPWHGPIPARVAHLMALTSFQPRAAAVLTSPTVTPSQRQANASSETYR